MRQATLRQKAKEKVRRDHAGSREETEQRCVYATFLEIILWPYLA